MSKTVTIPTDGGNPFVVILGGVKYVYKPGETVEVPDGVALEIEEWERWHEKYYAPTQPPFDDDDAGGGSGGLTKAQINALDGLFKIATYKTDPTTAYAAFKSAFGLNGSGGNTPDVPDIPDTSGYTVTNNLTNVTNSNSQTSITDGFYSATLTVVDGYFLKSLVITMGGVDITDSVYGDGGILIKEVTGDIVITAVAGDALAYKLPEPFVCTGTQTEVIDTGFAMYASGNIDRTVCVDMGYAVNDMPWSTPAYVTTVASGSNVAFRIDQAGDRVMRVWWGNSIAGIESTGRSVIYLPKDAKSISVYNLVDGVVTENTTDAHGGTVDDAESTVKIGHATIKGSINDFRVYEQKLSDAQIEAYLKGEEF